MSDSSNYHRLRWRAAILSLAVGVFMLLLKGTAYMYTDSVAILSDAMESVVHVGTTLAMVFSMRLLLQPPDARHPYGHGRIEHFSVGFEGGMIALAGLAIIAVTGYKLYEGYEPGAMGLGFAAMCLAALINLALGWYLLWVGHRARSPILVADGKHVLSDVWTSGGVAVGLLVVWLTGLVILDALIAFAVALYIFWEGSRLVRSAFSGLLDEVDLATLQNIVDVLNEQRRKPRHKEWIDVHSLRARRSGDDVHVDLHLVVPGQLTVRYMHGQLDELEAAILTRLQARGSVLVHLDYPAADLAEDELPDYYPNYDRPFDLAHCTRLTGDSEPSQEFAATADGPVVE